MPTFSISSQATPALSESSLISITVTSPQKIEGSASLNKFLEKISSEAKLSHLSECALIDQVQKFLSEKQSCAQLIQDIGEVLVKKCGAEYAATVLKKISTHNRFQQSPVNSNDKGFDAFVNSFLSAYARGFRRNNTTNTLQRFQECLQKDTIFDFLHNNPTANADGVVNLCFTHNHVDRSKSKYNHELSALEKIQAVSKEQPSKQLFVKYLTDLLAQSKDDVMLGCDKSFKNKTHYIPIIKGELSDDERIILQTITPLMYKGHPWRGCNVMSALLREGKFVLEEKRRKDYSSLLYPIPENGIITMEYLRNEDAKTDRPRISELTKKICNEFQDKEKMESLLEKLNCRVACGELTKKEGLEILEVIASNPNNFTLAQSLISRNKLRIFDNTDALVEHCLATLPIKEHSEQFLKYQALRTSSKGSILFKPSGSITIGKLTVTGELLNKLEGILTYQNSNQGEVCVAYLSQIIIDAVKTGDIAKFDNRMLAIEKIFNSRIPDLKDQLPYIIASIANGEYDKKESPNNINMVNYFTSRYDLLCSILTAEQKEKLNSIFSGIPSMLENHRGDIGHLFSKDLEGLQNKQIAEFLIGMSDFLTFVERSPEKIDLILDGLNNEAKSKEYYTDFAYSFIHLIAYPNHITQSGPNCLSTAYQIDLAYNTPEVLFDYAFDNFLRDPVHCSSTRDIMRSFQKGLDKDLTKLGYKNEETLNTIIANRGIKYDIFDPSDLDDSNAIISIINKELESQKAVLIGFRVYYSPGSCHTAYITNSVKDENGEIIGFEFVHGHGMHAFNGPKQFMSRESLLLSITDIASRAI